MRVVVRSAEAVQTDRGPRVRLVMSSPLDPARKFVRTMTVNQAHALAVSLGPDRPNLVVTDDRIQVDVFVISRAHADQVAVSLIAAASVRLIA